MNGPQVHYEVFARRRIGSDWTLEMATEDRALAVETAESLFDERRYAAVRVTKETLDPETREFRTVSILAKGALERARKKTQESVEPLCVTPQDLYSVHARARIGELLEDWLSRRRIAPFELLHRADLAEALEASGPELLHAVQKVAIPEAQARGVPTHQMMRTFQRLVERAIARVLKDEKRKALPDFAREPFAEACARLAGEPEARYLIGAGVARHIAGAEHWAGKVARLLDLADAAPEAGPARGVALQVIEQPLAEILDSRIGLSDILGASLDLGCSLAAMTRLAATGPVSALMAAEPLVARIMPPASSTAQRLAAWLEGDDFDSVRIALGRRVLAELNGPRRLKPVDPEGEIEMLRGLGMALTAAAGRLLPLEDVQAAFSKRSQMLVTGDFVESYLGRDLSPRAEADALVWLAENVIGAANKRHAARWLTACVSALKFEREVRTGPDSPAQKLAALAQLQRTVARAGLAPADYEPVQRACGEVAGLVESDIGLVAAVGHSKAPPVHRLTLLLRMAMGEAAPLGPVADRARAEAVRLLREPEIRAELVSNPATADRMRDLIAAAGLAA